jgi:hypothetical protein
MAEQATSDQEQPMVQQRKRVHIMESVLVSISKRLLLAIRKCDSAATPIAASKKEKSLWAEINDQRERLRDEVDLESLAALSEDAKKAFWINLYNSFLQLQLRDLHKENGYEDIGGATPGFIYKAKAIPIAGRIFSLDDIEHGVLRRCRRKHLYGYCPDLYTVFTCSSIRKLACKSLDCRLHFALNCGAKSCPPIAYYTSEKIDAQLDQAAAAFLRQETKVSPMNLEIHISKIFYWYYADFGGKQGIYDLLERYCLDDLQASGTLLNGSGMVLLEDNVLDQGKNPSADGIEDIRSYKLIYKEFSWEQTLDNFVFEADGMQASLSTLGRSVQ